MRIAITADLHLATRKEHPERYNALENILNQIDGQNIETLLIAGDLFNKDFQNYAEFESLCKKYPKIQIHIIPGNHDVVISEKDIVGSNIHVYTAPTAVAFDTTTFLFIPYREKAKMSEQIGILEEEVRGKDWVLISHGDYYGGTKELNPDDPETYMPLSRDNIATFRPRCVFLGHIHKGNKFDNVYYPGSPCGLDISETAKRRFLIYDTLEGLVEQPVATDVIYFDESFFIVPSDSEVPLLEQEIAQRIKSWNLDPTDYSNVIVRVQARGYATDRNAIFQTLKKGFDRFKYYNEEPLIGDLYKSSKPQLDEIAGRVMKLIDEQLEWDFGGDEPDQELVKIEALKVIHGA